MLSPDPVLEVLRVKEDEGLVLDELRRFSGEDISDFYKFLSILYKIVGTKFCMGMFLSMDIEMTVQVKTLC